MTDKIPAGSSTYYCNHIDCKPSAHLLHLTQPVQASCIVSTVIVMTSLGSRLMVQPPCLGHRKMYSICSMVYPFVSGIQMNMKTKHTRTTPEKTKNSPESPMPSEM